MTNPLDFTQRQTVLVVDDMPENLQLMNALLKEHYRTRIANSGERALKAAVQDPRPDLVLLDIMMPEMDGYEVCRRLKADEATRDIPVIFLTARADAAVQARCMALGALGCIAKPFNPLQLGDQIKALLT